MLRAQNVTRPSSLGIWSHIYESNEESHTEDHWQRNIKSNKNKSLHISIKYCSWGYVLRTEGKSVQNSGWWLWGKGMLAFLNSNGELMGKTKMSGVSTWMRAYLTPRIWWKFQTSGYFIKQTGITGHLCLFKESCCVSYVCVYPSQQVNVLSKCH